MTILIELQERGLLKDFTNLKTIEKLLESNKAIYCGFDPTAESLHVGSLLPLMTLLRLKRHGVKILPLLGGATGMIGDPSFKSAERRLNATDTVEIFKNGIKKQINAVLGEDVEIIDNISWTKDLNVLDFLRDFGKFFNVNHMIAKDSVKKRIEESDNGISFAEFSYQILQGMDFHHLFLNHNCAIQLGGSDQWGNMITGIDLIHKKEGNECDVGALTLPLLLKQDGTKFGKSETGAVWLDPKKTTPFEFFQFWLNVSDQEIKSFFKLLSFRKVKDINNLLLEDEKREKPRSQQLLAEELTEIIHGKENLNKVLSMQKILFGNDWKDLKEQDFLALEESHIKKIKIENVREEVDLIELMVSSQLVKSKRIAREMIKSNAVKINGVIVNEKSDHDVNNIFNESWLFDRFILIQKGKKDFRLIIK